MQSAECRRLFRLCAHHLLSFGSRWCRKATCANQIKRGTSAELDIPAMRTGIPVAPIHRRNAHLGPAAKALIGLMTNAALRLGDRAGNA